MFIPAIVPSSDDTVYIVEDDFGPIRRAWRETRSASADRANTLNDLYTGQFNDPVRVIAFIPREGWARDVSAELAIELQRRADLDREQPEGKARRLCAPSYPSGPTAVAVARLRPRSRGARARKVRSYLRGRS